MLSFGPFAFAAPWLLAGLAVLPALWWLLRVTPPAPKRIRFPALRLMLGLTPPEETPAKTPLWLILLRMVLATLVILALAQPLLNPRATITAAGPLVLAVDDGWGAARHWDEMRAALDRLIDQAGREGREIILFGTADPPGRRAAGDLSLLRPADARAAAAQLQPRPWPDDRAKALARFERLGLAHAAKIAWLSDGLDNGDAAAFAGGLARHGPLTVMAESSTALPRLLAVADPDDKDLTATVRRADSALPASVTVRALGDDGRLLARQTVTIPAGQNSAVARLPMPTELRNRVASIAIENEASAGAVLLLDERWKRRPVGIVARRDAAQPLLSGAYYLDKALSPFSEVREGNVATLIKGGIAVLAMPDGAPVGDGEKQDIVKWLENGGTVLRFAGPRLAAQADDNLLPVPLRRGDRTLGGALSWERPAKLAPFAAGSPFAGLAIPDDVTVSRQVLAEPTLDLASKTWARLADGTPLVTAARRGKGWLVLVHTTADPEWSNLAISGLMVDMLRRIVAQSQGISGESDKPLPPVETLDGFGRLQAAPAAVATIPAGGFAKTVAGPRHPPGFYGTADARRALNLAPAVTHFAPLPALPPGVTREGFARGAEIDFRPPLLALALLLMLADFAVGFALRGLLPRPGWRKGAAAGAVALCTLLGGPAARAAGDDAFASAAASQFHLAYVLTGVPDVDAESKAGLAGLSLVLNQRTAVDTATPMGVDPETDQLVFFPLLYWPVVEGERTLSPQAVARVQQYLNTGGIILFDTRDQEQPTTFSAAAAQVRLKRLAAGLDIPPLVPLAPHHVLTKSFYLMEDFPGRWSGSQLWVEPMADAVNDGVSSVIVGGNDWAGAWAVDGHGRPLYAAVPGGEPQREMAYRFGVNLVMYALTGNYKSDQVHVPAILERLGQ
ncbi:MAG: DUF4159 domain-containing protein [Alphaproteobacteria bacterium]|nr:DUF4159 domain-containing protein [Alphaproteobacteria bacterium]